MKLTDLQIDLVRVEMSGLLKNIFPDNYDRREVVDLITDDVVADIEETADWSHLKEDEVHTGDVEIALARVLKAAVVFNYAGE